MKHMRKSTIVKTWIWGLVIICAACCAAWSVSFLTDPGNALHGQTGTAVSLLILCGILALGGIVLQTVAWLGAVFNTQRSTEKSWFYVLLYGGTVGLLTMPLLGLGGLISWSATIPYLIAGPDGMAVEFEQLTAQAAPPTSA